ncbi:MAG: hypothetical protein O3C44_08235 [Proteobacteria bacterium]|nr:hypothetical protein [Pseudomonadota bacterium]MDA0845911.1 hypothetical protein [Pseudomonadota bacterium]
MTITAQSGPIRRSGLTILDVAANCGNETGTATRFDLGQYDPDTGVFTTHQYVTTVSLQTTQFPQAFYGFCKNGIRYDREDGLVSKTKGANGKNGQPIRRLAKWLDWREPQSEFGMALAWRGR